MYVNKIKLSSGYKMSWGRLIVVRHRLNPWPFILYDAEGWRTKPVPSKDVRNLVHQLGLAFYARSELRNRTLTTPNGTPVLHSQLEDTDFFYDRTLRCLYSASIHYVYHTVGRKYLLWSNDAEKGDDYIAAPNQKPIGVKSVVSKKKLAGFETWLNKIKDLNHVAYELDKDVPIRNGENYALHISRAYLAGATPHEAYADLPLGDWKFPPAYTFNVGTVYSEEPYLLMEV